MLILALLALLQQAPPILAGVRVASVVDDPTPPSWARFADGGWGGVSAVLWIPIDGADRYEVNGRLVARDVWWVMAERGAAYTVRALAANGSVLAEVQLIP